MRRSWLRLFWAGVVVAVLAASYLLYSGLGDRFLHEEIETQLSRLLSGRVEIARVELHIVDGLRVEAHGFEAYRGTHPDDRPALSAARVLAWIDILSLLVGRLELSTLVLEGPQLRVEQRADGSFVGLPIPTRSDPSEGDPDVDVAERVVRDLEALEPMATAFAERFRAADRIEIQNATLQWIDHSLLDADGRPRSIRLELVSGMAERDWLSDAIHVDLQAVFVDGKTAPFPLEIGVHRKDSPHFEWTASFSRIPLEAAEIPLAFIKPIDGIAGTFDANFRLTTTGKGEHLLRFDGVVENATISLRRSRSIVAQKRLALRAEFALDPKRLEIASGRLEGEQLSLDFNATVARPIRPASRTHIETRLLGARIAGIRELAQQFEGEFDLALAVTRLTDRVEKGEVSHVKVAGTAPLRHWKELSTGQSQDLPEEFTVVSAVQGIAIGSGTDDLLEDLEGEIEWADDQVTFRNMNAVYHGVPLPETTAVIEGVSHLIRSAESARVMTSNPDPVPGFGPLVKIFKPRDPDALPPVKAITLEIESLEHPMLRWPLRDARISIEPLSHGFEVDVREGIWAGASVAGHVAWRSLPGPASLSARLVLGPAPTASISEALVDSATDARSAESEQDGPLRRWGSGRFEVQFRPQPSLPFERASGFFRLDGTDLVGHEVTVELDGSGQAALQTRIDLREPEFVGLDLSFAITEATLEGLSVFVALPPDLMTGAIGATGSLAGPVRPDVNFIAELAGRVRIEAQNGRILTSLPLLFRLTRASEGYNPFAHSDELQYESMTGTLEVDHGWLAIEDFEIEGPLRVFANARLDTNRSPGDIRAVVGIFLFRTSGEILGNIPLVRSFLPGSERGLIGAYFEVEGPVDEPRVETLALETLMSSVPDAIKAPFKVLRYLFGRKQKDS